MQVMKMRYLRDKNGKVDKTYAIAEDGSYIRNRKTGEKIIPYIHNGYNAISIRINGSYYNAIKICHLQWLAWYGIIPKGYNIHHKKFSNDKKLNRDLKLNDHIDNLDCIIKFKHLKLHNSGKNSNFYGKSRFGENAPMYGKHHSEETKEKQRMANIGIFSGEKSSNAKLTMEKVKRIRYLGYVRKWKQQKIANEFGISKGCINHVLQGDRWNLNELTKGQLIVQTIGGK
jgi:hypothetical protein